MPPPLPAALSGTVAVQLVFASALLLFPTSFLPTGRGGWEGGDSLRFSILKDIHFRHAPPPAAGAVALPSMMSVVFEPIIGVASFPFFFFFTS